MGRHRQSQRFRADLVGGVYNATDFTKRGLPEDHHIQQRVRVDGQEVIYWRETASGWVLGFALVWNGQNFEEYMYAAPHNPTGLASEGTEGWGALWETPPDWT